MTRPETIPAAVADVLRHRRTVGAFEPDLPSAAIVDAALELATWAPNHRKTEPWRFLKLGPEMAAAVVELNARLIEEKKGPEAAESKRKQWSRVPGWLVVTCPLSTDSMLQEEDYAACCCAIQNLSLALWSTGVGTKWSTGDVTRHPEFFQLLDLDATKVRVVGLIWYGYPQANPQQTRTPVSEFVRTLP